MDRTPVESSNIAEIGFDPNSLTLEVAFKNGSVYQYFDVPQTVYEELMQADSKGGYLNHQIKNSYRCARM